VAELRKDPTTRRWAIIATERWKRPNDLVKKPGAKAVKRACPFDPGSPEIEAATVYPHFSHPDKWKVWVMPNKFPALTYEGMPSTTIKGPFTTINAVGGHEVFVDSADHNNTLAKMKPIEIEAILNGYRERFNFWNSDTRVKYVLIFKNYGEAAGASLAHPHSQLAAIPVVPPRVVEEMDKAEHHYKDHKHCIMCDLIRDEIALNKRVAFMNDRFIVLCPFASRFPFEAMILPREHSSNFMSITNEDIVSLADIMSRLFKRMANLLDDPPLNYLLHVAPQYAPNLRFYHWHIEIIPRLTQVAGFEWGAGVYINPTPPEEAARELGG
jgi:UDPglucose--hexose-1-phosphate uridylyltransferase